MILCELIRVNTKSSGAYEISSVFIFINLENSTVKIRLTKK